MWMTSAVELPTRLLDSLEKRNLVVFAGAGISIDAPAGMPSFRGLVTLLGAEAGRTPTERDFSEPDVFLADLERHDFDVHTRTAQILSNPLAKPNSYHISLVNMFGDMFGDSQGLRIVTTNHDLLFSHAASDSIGGFTEYAAPALPVGDDFSGVVYLHGSAGLDPRYLVLTDDDFGRAYLTQGWATSFLRSMYSRFDVVFVGYSHGEAVLRYLARGLTGDRSRFAFVPEGDDLASWHQLGITPIGYPRHPEPKAHEALEQVVSTWAERSRMGYADHAGRIKSATLGSPPLTPDEIDYLHSLFRDAVTARQFAMSKCSVEWLEFVRDVPEFRQLFSPIRGDEITASLAAWFVRNYVLDHAAAAQALVQELGPQLSTTLWQQIALALWTAVEHPPPEIFGSWVAILLASPSSAGSEFLEYLLDVCSWPDDAATAMTLLWFLTEPTIEVGATYGDLEEGRPGATIGISLRGSADAISAFYRATIEPHLAEVSGEIEVLVAAQLEHAHAILMAAGQATREFDMISMFRPTVDGTDA